MIHHAGALGGGHYATTARSLHSNARGGGGNGGSGGNKSGFDSSTAAATAADGTNAENTTTTTPSSTSSPWHCFNDNVVSVVEDVRDICSPSAYVLFYLRQDMRHGDVLALLRKQLSVPGDAAVAGPVTVAVDNNAGVATSAAVVIAETADTAGDIEMSNNINNATATNAATSARRRQQQAIAPASIQNSTVGGSSDGYGGIFAAGGAATATAGANRRIGSGGDGRLDFRNEEENINQRDGVESSCIPS